MKIINGQVLTDHWVIEPLNISLANSKIAKIEAPASSHPAIGGDVIDAAGCYVVPGLVDIHLHGCNGSDFCDATPDSVANIAGFLARHGTTSFLGTIMTLPESRIDQILENGCTWMNGKASGATLRGMRLEGPFLALGKKGAQPAESIREPDLDLLNRLLARAPGAVKMIDIAPERPGALTLIRRAREAASVSLGHTDTDYDSAILAFEAGASHVTHLFNAMKPFLHRSPGLIGAAFDAKATVELIADGLHLHPVVVRSVFRWFGADQTILVSDAMRACGLADGTYELGGQPVQMTDGRAVLADGTLAGSTATLLQCVRNAIHFDIPATTAIRAATQLPARVISEASRIGQITVGHQADLLLLDQDFRLVKTIIGGTVYS